MFTKNYKYYKEKLCLPLSGAPPKKKEIKKSSNEKTLEQKKNWQLPIFARNYRRRISA